MQIEILNETTNLLAEDLKELIVKATDKVLECEGFDVEGEVSILFVDDNRIKSLNNEFRHKNEVTDVLSFPQYDSIKDDGLNEPFIYLGDVVISLEQAKRQAEEFGHSIEREIVYLTIHSMLHLFGYDHMSDADKKEMREKEKKVIRSLKLFKGTSMQED
ncbi:MAG TPA: rRNA maturation RNase YbeY [Clostridiales bacterium UBA8960]|nr:rRNA maturation RNase YbeY [Clostridiales bacterium UBA8960]